ncbi:nitrous oxide reductase accessory protein NosL [Halovivax gelatinilyticus]|uniref:nitrous oxide reductase accessory protein NosL n=1 Tax=Halovivax gelatinilyticus TaxID=2961597 RepID=UPI0020CA4D62|nr:nitrous oxide reductase accessory protein NosL [Halovivax gelatinilyticus]
MSQPGSCRFDRTGRQIRSRRAVLTTLAGSAAALAGCTDLGGSGGNDDGDPTDDPGGAGDFYNAGAVAQDDHPITEPASFDRTSCPVCNMSAENAHGWMCQLAHADGTGLFFDSPGCLLAYYVLPETHATDDDVERIWFTDYQTRDLFDAEEGYLIDERNFDRHSYPMSGSPLPVETDEQAEAYVEEYDDLSEDDVNTIDDVDREFAEFYRGNRMP